jgi:hypothetical protein
MPGCNLVAIPSLMVMTENFPTGAQAQHESFSKTDLHFTDGAVRYSGAISPNCHLDNQMQNPAQIAIKSEVLRHLHNHASKTDKVILVVPRLFVTMLGDHESALILSQMLYWSEYSQSNSRWFYKTNIQWMDELCLTRHVVHRALRKLEDTGFLQVSYRKVGGNRVCHYRILETPLMAALNHEIGLNNTQPAKTA